MSDLLRAWCDGRKLLALRLTLDRMTPEERSKLLEKIDLLCRIKRIPGYARFLAAVCQNGMALRYGPDSLRDDLYIVLSAVRRSPNAIHYASPKMQACRRVMLAAVSRDGTVLRFLPSRSDRDVVLAAVRQNGLAIQYADRELRLDKDVVLAANVLAIRYADRELRLDKDVVLAAVRQNVLAIRYADRELRLDKDVVLAAVRQNVLAIRYADRELRLDKDVVLAAVRQNGLAILYADRELQLDKDVVLAAVRQDGLAIRFAGGELQRDKDVVLAAVSSDGEAVRYARYRDGDIWRAAVSTTGAALRWLWRRNQIGSMLMHDLHHADEATHERAIREVELAAVQSDGCALQYVRTNGKADRDVVLAAVRRDGRALQYASPELRADHLVVSTAARCSGVQVVFFLSDAQRWDPRLSPWLRLSPRACAWRRVRGAIWRAAIVAFWRHKTHLPHHATMLHGMAALTELLSPVPLGIDARVRSKCEHADTIDLQHEMGGWWSGTLKDAFVSF
ncbi:hypothetical protein AB1Y20_013848 [Prymnesium parvum]|uniref:DUF4116 domain-containing protein n=1 Tax=Prymnesium parvum TaxID=97485 RepID=A0AB34IHL4_PRYPA